MFLSTKLLCKTKLKNEQFFKPTAAEFEIVKKYTHVLFFSIKMFMCVIVHYIIKRLVKR